MGAVGLRSIFSDIEIAERSPDKMFANQGGGVGRTCLGDYHSRSTDYHHLPPQLHALARLIAFQRPEGAEAFHRVNGASGINETDRGPTLCRHGGPDKVCVYCSWLSLTLHGFGQYVSENFQSSDYNIMGLRWIPDSSSDVDKQCLLALPPITAA